MWRRAVLALAALAIPAGVSAQPRPRPERVPIRREVQGLPTRPPLVCDHAELVVRPLQAPQYNGSTGQTSVPVVVANVGRAGTGGPFVIDFAGYNNLHRAVGSQALGAGESRTLTIQVPGSLFQPDAHYIITADYGNLVNECSEENNTQEFRQIG